MRVLAGRHTRYVNRLERRTGPVSEGRFKCSLVDRRYARDRDEGRLRVAWPRGDEATLLFRDCYAMTAEMNFGVIAEERIVSASLIDDDPVLTSIRDR